MFARQKHLKNHAAIDFYHVMVYVRDVGKSKEFYEALGFEPVEEMDGYVRLRSPGGVGTIALHKKLKTKT